MTKNEFGRVKWFNRRDGFGFIVPDSGGRDVAFVFAAIEGSGYRNAYAGDRVRFSRIEREKGPAALFVRRLH